MTGSWVMVDRERAQASLHALSQPLTVMSLALTMVQCSADEVERAQALEAVVTECKRAMHSIYQLRSVLDGEAEPGAGPEGSGALAGSRMDWIFGGRA